MAVEDGGAITFPIRGLPSTEVVSQIRGGGFSAKISSQTQKEAHGKLQRERRQTSHRIRCNTSMSIFITYPKFKASEIDFSDAFFHDNWYLVSLCCMQMYLEVDTKCRHLPW